MESEDARTAEFLKQLRKIPTGVRAAGAAASHFGCTDTPHARRWSGTSRIRRGGDSIITPEAYKRCGRNSYEFSRSTCGRDPNTARRKSLDHTDGPLGRIAGMVWDPVRGDWCGRTVGLPLAPWSLHFFAVVCTLPRVIYGVRTVLCLE